MSKQQKTYLLLIIVVAVWGLIGYQIYNHLNPDVPSVKKVFAKKYIPKIQVKKEKYTLKGAYRDPFLGKMVTQKTTKRRQEKKPTMPFPSIQYNGVVQGGKNTSYIITVDNQQEILKVGKTFQKITLVYANSTKIKVRFQGVTKVIQLHQ